MNVNTTTSLPSCRTQVAERFTRVHYGWCQLIHDWQLQRMICWSWLLGALVTNAEPQRVGKRHIDNLVTWYIKSSFKGCWKADFYIRKWMQRKQPADAAPRWSCTQHYTQTSRTAANAAHSHTFSVLCELVFNASQSYTCYKISKHSVSLFPTVITVDN